MKHWMPLDQENTDTDVRGFRWVQVLRWVLEKVGRSLLSVSCGEGGGQHGKSCFRVNNKPSTINSYILSVMHQPSNSVATMNPDVPKRQCLVPSVR